MWVAIGVGGAAGAMARAAIAGAVQRWAAARGSASRADLPTDAVLAALPTFDPSGSRWIGTLAVNLVGCLAIGVLWRWMDHAGSPEWVRREWVRAGLLTGMLGAFTTFSTFGLDLLHLVSERRLGLGAVYAGLSVGLGLLLVRVGHGLAGAFVPPSS